MLKLQWERGATAVTFVKIYYMKRMQLPDQTMQPTAMEKAKQTVLSHGWRCEPPGTDSRRVCLLFPSIRAVVERLRGPTRAFSACPRESGDRLLTPSHSFIIGEAEIMHV